MERRALAISIGISCLATYLVWQYISTTDKELEDNYGKSSRRNVVIASKNILQYETIRPLDIEIVQVPKAMLQPGIIQDPKAVVGAVAAIPISQGEQILDNKIISKNIYSGLDTQVASGKRAISIPVTVKSAVGYLLRPGNRVDLAAHFEYKTQKAAISEVKVFMQDLLVLAAGRTIQSDPPKGVDQGIVNSIRASKELASPLPEDEIRETLNYAKTDVSFNTVTLEVTPQQAQAIVLVLSLYADSIILLLRHADDRQLDRVQTTNLFDVMGADSYLVKGNRAPPPQAIPRIRFFDYIGNQRVPVTEGR